MGVVEAALANARINLQYSRIAAPISGVVDLSTVSVGALVSANQAQPLTAITLRASFPNPEHLLMPGMYVRAQLATGRNEQAVLVPQQAVIRDSAGNPSVQIIAQGNKIAKRPISLGQAVGNE